MLVPGEFIGKTDDLFKTPAKLHEVVPLRNFFRSTNCLMSRRHDVASTYYALLVNSVAVNCDDGGVDGRASSKRPTQLRKKAETSSHLDQERATVI